MIVLKGAKLSTRAERFLAEAPSNRLEKFLSRNAKITGGRNILVFERGDKGSYAFLADMQRISEKSADIIYRAIAKKEITSFKHGIFCAKIDGKQTFFKCLSIGEGKRIVAVSANSDDMGFLLKQSLRYAENLKSMAMNDPLTGLLNRRGFAKEAYMRLVREALRKNHNEQMNEVGKYSVALAIVDADKFKSVNDTYGHDVGDEVLKHVVRTLQSQMRSGSFIGRYGGEEFVAACVCKGPDEAKAFAERLRHTLATTSFEFPDGKRPVTVSIGVALREPVLVQNSNIDVLREAFEKEVKPADIALYAAKESGRNCVRLYDEISLPIPCATQPGHCEYRTSGRNKPKVPFPTNSFE